MKYNIKDFFVDTLNPRVPGFVVIEQQDSQYRMLERIERDDGTRSLYTFWMSGEKLQEMLANGTVERDGSLSDEQFTEICQKGAPRALSE